MQAAFPHLALNKTAQFYIAGQSLQTQTGIAGADTVVPTMRGRWMASASFVLDGEAATLQWQAFLAQMQGRIGTTLVPVPSRYRPKDRNGRHLPYRRQADVAGAQTWEHFGFETAPRTLCRVASAAPLRATQIDIELPDTTGLRPGQYFSIGERLHQVQAHWQPEVGVHRIMFVPPLREAVVAKASIEIERPVCRMRMVTETEGLFEQLLDPLPVVTVQFAEAM